MPGPGLLPDGAARGTICYCKAFKDVRETPLGAEMGERLVLTCREK